MKKFYAILCITIASLTQLQAQAPQGFNYQATVRNSAGDLIVNTNVYFKFNIMQGSQTSLPVFTEIHYVPTDDLGQVNLVIGQGTATTGVFSQLDWSLGSYYLGIELDTGNGYVAMGTTQLLSVPYALYAENSGNAPPTPNLQSVLAENNSANNQQIKDLHDPTDAQDAVTKAYVDALSNSQGLMNFNDWTNYQIWSDFMTMEIETNSFVFINANSPTLILPSDPSEMDVIYIYTTKSDGYNHDESIINFGANGNPITVTGSNSPTTTSQTNGYVVGRFSDTGLQTLIFVGGQWYIGNFYLEGLSVTDQDGNSYDYITYGDQVWTVENAEMVTYRDGTPIPQVTDATEWESLTTGAWCYYDNDPTKSRLYNWYAVMGIHDTDPNTPNKEFAPEGWHVPTDAEWTTLEEYLIANGYNYDGTTTDNKIAKSMASTTGWNGSTGLGVVGNDQSTNNSSLFNAFPCGYRFVYNTNDFFDFGNFAVYWSSSEFIQDFDYARNRTLGYNGYELWNGQYYKKHGFSVRFVRD
jgi:uncharacterized protein (TIGR02145 family)